MMNVPTKLGLYGAGLGLVFGGALGLGVLVGPLLPATATEDADSGSGASHEEAAPMVPAGLQISQDGYTLDSVEVPAEAGEEAPLSFRVLGPDGDPVTEFRESHDKLMHLIVVGRDMTGFQHVHPEMDDEGTWSIPLELADPGAYRVFADFAPEDLGDGLTLGADVTVSGDHEARPLPEPARTDEVGDYTVELEGELVPGRANELTLTVSRDGEPVTDLEPYLGAYGHLVALRDGDLAYLHVHPEGGPADGETAAGPEVAFQIEVPSTGDYRLFLDFKHDGEVRTAEFTRAADGSGPVDTDTRGGDHADDGTEEPEETDHSH